MKHLQVRNCVIVIAAKEIVGKERKKERKEGRRGFTSTGKTLKCVHAHEGLPNLF
jgi:hypothetical protein